MQFKGDWLEISDIDKFVDYIRGLVYINFSLSDADDTDENLTQDFLKADVLYESFTDEERKEIDDVLNKKECTTIVKDISRRIKHKTTKEIKYIINNRMLFQIIENVNQRLVSNVIKNLVAKGLLESAFDEELNDFVFWAKERDEDGDSQT